MKKQILFIVMLIVLSMFVAAEYPTIVPYVNDFAGLLTNQEMITLTERCAAIKQRYTVEVAIVSVQNTNGEDRVIYANRLGDKSGVGNAETDNGLVLLWSLDNEKGGAIATGRGIESTFNDAKVGRIGRASRPYFDAGEYYNGYNSMLDEIEVELNGTSEYTAASTNLTFCQQFGLDDGRCSVLIIFIVILVIALIFCVFAVAAAGGGGGGSYHSSSYIGHSVGSGGWSSGGGSFGGGSFGGGGAKF